MIKKIVMFGIMGFGIFLFIMQDNTTGKVITVFIVFIALVFAKRIISFFEWIFDR